MDLQRTIKVEREGTVRRYVYYVKKVYSDEFEREMYNVGIREDDRDGEVRNFSCKEDEAVEFMEYLYRENATVNTLFLLGEEFIERY